MTTIRLKRLPEADPAVDLPAYATEGAAGADLRANLAPADRETGLILDPGARLAIPTGLAAEIPEGYEMQLRPRSGLALRHGLTLLNSPGTVDSDFRGEIKVLMVNLGDSPQRIEHGTRIAQAVIAPVTRARFDLAEALSESDRAAGGFGSTGRG